MMDPAESEDEEEGTDLLVQVLAKDLEQRGRKSVPGLIVALKGV